MRTVTSLLFIAAVFLAACSNSNHVSRYDPSMYQGLANARTALNTYLPDNPTGHRYDRAFFVSEYAEFGTLYAQARNTPLDDSATTKWIVAADSALTRLEYVEHVLQDTTSSHLLFFRDEVNADIDAALTWEKMKLTSQLYSPAKENAS